MVDAIVKDGCSPMGTSPSRVWIDFHLLSYHWWFLFLRWHSRFLELNFYRDYEQLLLWFTFLFYDTSLSTDKCLKVEKWAGKGTRSQSWVGHHVEGIACLRTADCTIGFMLTQAVSKPLPGMACLLAAFITCDVRSALRLLGRNGWDCELQRHSHLSLELTTGIGRTVAHLAW